MNKKYKHEITTITSAIDLLYIKINGINYLENIKKIKMLNVYGISRAFFHKFYIDYLVNNILKI